MKPKEPKKPTRTTRCGTCNEKLGDKNTINCQLCVEWICLPCAKISDALYKFCEDNDESMALLCEGCKLEIPALREMKCIRTKQAQIEAELQGIQKTSAETNETITTLTTTQTVQGVEIQRLDKDLLDVFNRLKVLESAAPPPAVEGSDGTTTVTWPWATKATKTQAHSQIQTIVRSEINEQAEIDKIRMNLVISGIKETNDDEADKAVVMQLIQDELGITADISKTDRIGKSRKPKEGEGPLPPRLIKLFFVTQRSRKEVLAKVTNLRNSTNEIIKTLVYIRPDLTPSQITESKNLRTILKTTREQNPTKSYKIYRNKIIETQPAEQPPAPVAQPLATPAAEAPPAAAPVMQPPTLPEGQGPTAQLPQAN